MSLPSADPAEIRGSWTPWKSWKRMVSSWDKRGHDGTGDTRTAQRRGLATAARRLAGWVANRSPDRVRAHRDHDPLHHHGRLDALGMHSTSRESSGRIHGRRFEAVDVGQ